MIKKPFGVFILLNILAIAQSLNTIVLDSTNNVVLRGGITEKLADEFIISLTEKTPTYVYISSNGGSIMAGNRIISQLSQYNLTCIAERAYSMAFVILQACNIRLVTPFATVMQHQASLGIQGDIYPITNYLKMIHSMEQQMNRLQSSRVQMDEDAFRTLTTTEWWLFGEDIIKNNVADEIVNVKCSKELLEKNVTSTKYGFFDERAETYSACPLISKPLEVEYKDKVYHEKQESPYEFINVDAKR